MMVVYDMIKHPLIRALLASLYISGVSSIIWGTGNLFKDVEPGIMGPIGFLSLFVFSAAVMAYLFVYEPLVLLLAGKKEEAVTFFLKTVAWFAAVTLGLVATWVALMYLVP